MANLATSYLGLNLKNPIVVSSSGLTNSVDKIIELEKNGAAAVVLKSIFEEQINYEIGELNSSSDYPEASDYLKAYVESNELDQYIKLIRDCKQKVTIPIIASVNCITADQWLNYAKKIESAGADAIEVNVFYLPDNLTESGSEYEQLYFDIAARIKEEIKIPVAFKIGPNFTNPMYIANQLHIRKVDALVLFNRFYSPDIDIDNLKISASEIFSTPVDIRQTLRWIGISSNKIKGLQLSASTGVHDGSAAIKLLLAGADTVQVCSVLYKNGSSYLKNILSDIERWMKKQNYKTIDDFKGKLSYEQIPDAALYERVQFMKYYSSKK